MIHNKQVMVIVTTVLMMLLCPAKVMAEDCKNVRIGITGNLFVHAALQMTSDERILDGSTISLPLEGIGGSDAELIARLRRTDDLVWYLDVRSIRKGDSGSDNSFRSMFPIDFSSDGQQRIEQRMLLHSLSSDESASRELLDVRVEGLTISDAPTLLRATEIGRAPGKCPAIGEIDVNNEVNGGKPVEVRYYSAEEVDAAMRNDK